jgi:hypothetical protein
MTAQRLADSRVLPMAATAATDRLAFATRRSESSRRSLPMNDYVAQLMVRDHADRLAAEAARQRLRTIARQNEPRRRPSAFRIGPAFGGFLVRLLARGTAA